MLKLPTNIFSKPEFKEPFDNNIAAGEKAQSKVSSPPRMNPQPSLSSAGEVNAQFRIDIEPEATVESQIDAISEVKAPSQVKIVSGVKIPSEIDVASVVRTTSKIDAAWTDGFLKSDVRQNPLHEAGDISGRQVLEKVKVFYQSVNREMRKVIVGQQEVIDFVVMALLCKGHVLLEGVPGLGKTLMFKTFSKILDLDFRHVQFTPDLMPSDIIGTEIIQQNEVTQRREMQFLKGPIFSHFLLADEINRTSPKTQSSLLQAMQDREVSVGNKTYRLDEPFFVLATQNPIDHEGVYPLPEAQLDRFFFNLYIDYPTAAEEVSIAQRYTQPIETEVDCVISRENILTLQHLVRGLLISDSILKYAVDLVIATRPSEKNPYNFVKSWVEWGSGPRATLNLVLAAKARALLKGRFYVSCEDIRAVAVPVFRHRIKMNFAAEADNVKAMDVIQKILQSVPEPKNKN
jgi:MoxR-like ATPase